jgi:hypothetical protein
MLPKMIEKEDDGVSLKEIMEDAKSKKWHMGRCARCGKEIDLLNPKQTRTSGGNPVCAGGCDES